MNILIIAGGSGSVELQKGLRAVIPFELGKHVKIQVLTNLYDNGLSTGLVRKVCEDRILGPSDLRKNQTLVHELYYGKTPLLDLLNIRFTIDASSAELYCLEKVRGFDPILTQAVRVYFKQPLAKEIEYSDFSLANIIYAGIAVANYNSMEAAGKTMAKVLEIPEDAIIVSSDESLFLKAQTQSGYIIADEGDIVSWSNADDPIVSTFLSYGRERHGQVDAYLSEEASDALKKADIIIFSSGTQFSSLIPTYQTQGFRDALALSEARMYLVMNRTQDKDVIGWTAQDILNTVGHYIRPDWTSVIIDNSADPLLQQVDDESGYGNIIRAFVGSSNGKKHDGVKLALEIFKDYFGISSKTEAYLFDYDDTIMPRDPALKTIGTSNIRELNNLRQVVPYVGIVTGSTLAHLNDAKVPIGCDIFWAGGNVLNSSNFDVIDHNLSLSDDEIDEIMNALSECGILRSATEIRGLQRVVVKPVVDRNLLMCSLIDILGDKFFIEAVGKTSVEICRFYNDKSIVLEHPNISKYRNTLHYVCDDVYGNDLPLVEDIDFETGSFVTGVKGPIETALMLRTIILLKDLR